MRSHSVCASLTAAAIAFVALLPAPARAVPAFSRRYGTSCATCHISFPRLTPFGEAFWRNGYAYPEGDADVVHEERLSLGSDAYRSLFPNAVWPGDMPSVPPVSFVLTSWFAATNDEERPRATFDNFEALGNLYLAGTLGSNLSFFGRFGIGDSRASQPQHQRWHVTVRDLIPRTTIRVGDIVPELFRVPRTSCENCHFAQSRPVGDNHWFLGPDYGIEAAGTIAGRFRWVAGVLEGRGNLSNSAKDLYARIGTRIGGTRLDGVVVPGHDVSSDNWVDNSVDIGVFGYHGLADVATVDAAGGAATVDDRFVSAGIDLNVTFGSFTFYAIAVGEWHSRPTFGNRDVLVERYLAEMRYVVWPWLVPSVSFEYFNTELPTDMQWKATASVEMLYRANVKLTLDAEVRRPVRTPLRFEQLRLSLTVGL